MTRTKDTGGGKSGNLQTTKLPARREVSTLKVQDSIPNTTLRDIFLDPTLKTDLFQRKEHGPGGDQCKSVRGGNLPARKAGLGSVMLNLKPNHIYSGKKSVDPNILSIYRERFPLIANKGGCTTEDDTESICNSIGKLSIQEDENVKEKGKGLMRKSFLKLVSERHDYESGQQIAVMIDDTPELFKKSSSAIRKASVRNWTSPEVGEDLHNGQLRNLFSWSLPTSTRWKEVEERITRWGSKMGEVSSEHVCDLLNISSEDLKHLRFHKDLEKIVNVLRNHICHSNLPWLATLLGVSELQTGNVTDATRYSANSQGTFLHSEIVDKHLCYISRNEEIVSAIGQRSSFSAKSELFRKQIQDTMQFGKSANGTEENLSFIKTISSFDSNWNVLQITALLQPKNRFGMDLYSRRQIPQLLISAMAHVPNEKERACFTTFCYDPQVCEGSLMRQGLMEEFQKILDRNLVISDDTTIISRKQYWEERRRHNDAMMGIIQAMEEEWIAPWNFLFPGHTTHRDIQHKIYSKIIVPCTKKYKLTSSQKLLLYKLTENYKCLHDSTASALEVVVSFILKVPESGLNTICKKIREIGSEVPEGDRYPTILVIEQDLEIYPWESMSCLAKTDVTRMPSLNLINSNYNFVSSLRPFYPNIVDNSSCTFVLNPDGTLPNVQKRLEKYFADHAQWVPIIGRPPATKEVQECLENQHIFLYNGHGAGSNFYPDYAIQKIVCQAVPLLMGCASAQAYYAVPRVYGSSTIHSYFLAGCPSVVGYLWEITDAECDRITVDLIERWLPDPNIRPPKILFLDQDAKRAKENCLPTAMRISRTAATQFLTQCAIVCYGLPINTQIE